MAKSALIKVQSLMLIVMLAGVLAACGANATPTPVPEPTATTAPARPTEAPKPTDAPKADTTAGTTSAASGLVGTIWEWQGTVMNGAAATPIPTPAKPGSYTLEFGNGGNVKVQADCNNGTATYTVDGDKLTIGPIGMTMMACPEGSLDSQFLQGLSEVFKYKSDGGNLSLILKSNSGTMTFAPGSSSSTGSRPAAPLQGKIWTWQKTTMNDGTVYTPTTPLDYRLMFLPGGNLNIKADCNNASGTYKVDGNNLTLTPGPMTMMACPEGSLDSVFLKNIGEVTSFLIQGDNLILELKLDSGSMTFAPALDNLTAPATGSTELTGQVWQWQQTLMNDGTKTAPASPANYTLEFLTTGKLNIKADCNNAGGTYTVEGNKLTITSGPMTMMACPEGSLDTAYLKGLNEASSYLMDGPNLVIELKLDSGTMTFAPTK